MQEEGMFIVFFIMIVTPLILLFSYHELFFIVIAIVIFISSVIGIKNKLLGKQTLNNPEEEAEAIEELEDYINLDLKKFEMGTRVVRHSIALVFFIYSSFFVRSVIFRIMIAFVLVYWVYKILEDVLAEKNPLIFIKSSRLNDYFMVLSSSAMMIIVMAVTLNKFSGINI